MRYRETELIPGSTDYVAPTTDDFVDLTVGLTLIIGALMLAGGIYGKQRWLKIWGTTTLVACAVYYGWVYLYLPGT